MITGAVPERAGGLACTGPLPCWRSPLGLHTAGACLSVCAAPDARGCACRSHRPPHAASPHLAATAGRDSHPQIAGTQARGVRSWRSRHSAAVAVHRWDAPGDGGSSGAAPGSRCSSRRRRAPPASQAGPSQLYGRCPRGAWAAGDRADALLPQGACCHWPRHLVHAAAACAAGGDEQSSVRAAACACRPRALP